MNTQYYLDALDLCVARAIKENYSGPAYVIIKDIKSIVESDWEKTAFNGKFPITPRRIGPSLRRLGGCAYRGRDCYGYQFDDVDNI